MTLSVYVSEFIVVIGVWVRCIQKAWMISKHLCPWEDSPSMSDCEPRLYAWCYLHEFEAVHPTRESHFPGYRYCLYTLLWVSAASRGLWGCFFIIISAVYFLCLKEHPFWANCFNWRKLHNHCHLLQGWNFLYQSGSVLHLHNNDNNS